MVDEESIAELVRRAGFVEPLPGGAGTIDTEPIIVLKGGHKSDLGIFDQHGHPIATAERSRGRYSRDGYQYRYEVGGAEPVFTVTDVSKGRWISVPRDFVIAAADGSVIATGRRYTDEGAPVIKRDDRPFEAWESFLFERDGEVIATLWKTPRKELRKARAAPAASAIGSLRRLHDRFVSGRLFYVEDQTGRAFVRIWYLSGSSVGYVLEMQAGASGLQSTIAVAACLVADNAFVSPPGGGGN